MAEKVLSAKMTKARSKHQSVYSPMYEPRSGIVRCKPNDSNIARIRSCADSIAYDWVFIIVFIAACAANHVEVMLFAMMMLTQKEMMR